MSLPDLAHPEWSLPGLGIWLLAAAALCGARRRTIRRGERLLGRRVGSPEATGTDLTLLLAGLLVGVALLGPRVGERTVRIPATGVDVVLLVDVSRSMDARDNPPSRLARARETARRVLRELSPGDRAALAIFAGGGALLTPLTPDKQALTELLPALGSDWMSDAGSRLEAGLEVALEAFDAESLRPRSILVLTDGEHAARTPAAAVRALARADVRLLAAVFGTEEGSPVPYGGETLRDGRGKEVVSRRDTASLDRFSEMTRGAVFQADGWGEIDGTAVNRALLQGGRATADGWIERREPVSRTRPLTALAFGFLLLDWLFPGRSPRGRRPGSPGAGALLVLPLLLAQGVRAGDPPEWEAELRRRPEDARLLLAVGRERAETGREEEAEHAFRAAAVRARDPELAALAYYDLGVLALRRGALETARDAFFDALALDPADRAAKLNLEWTLRALSEDLPRIGDEEDAEGNGEPGGPTDEAAPSRPESEAESSAEEPEAAHRPPGAAPRAQPPPPLGPEEAARWLEAVEDDPGRALRSAMRGRSASTPRGGPRW